MSILDIDSLLQEITPGQPCGEDLEYDARFGELERAAQGKTEQQYGDTVVPAEEPDWRQVRALSLDLLNSTKDLRILVLLTKALLRTDGLAGFYDGLCLIHQIIEQHWACLYPLLDPDDGNDPTFRNNILLDLCDYDNVLRALRDTPLIATPAIGRFSLRDIQRARGQLAAMDGDVVPDPSVINAAIRDCNIDGLHTLSQSVDGAIGETKAIEAALAQQMSISDAPSLKPLASVLIEIKAVLDDALGKRGITSTPLATESSEVARAATPAPLMRPVISGEIASREDAIRALDRVCEYFYNYEPSSPVPLLLQRAKRLVPMSFMEILRDMAPEALNQAQLITGAEADQQ